MSGIPGLSLDQLQLRAPRSLHQCESSPRSQSFQRVTVFYVTVRCVLSEQFFDEASARVDVVA